MKTSELNKLRVELTEIISQFLDESGETFRTGICGEDTHRLMADAAINVYSSAQDMLEFLKTERQYLDD